MTELTRMVALTRARRAASAVAAPSRPTARAGAAAAGDVAEFFLVEWCWRIRGDDGALAIGATADAAVAGAGGSYRVIEK